MTPKNKIVVFDLDDTLYKEEEFLKSAFLEIAHRLPVPLSPDSCLPTPEEVFIRMMAWWKEGENVFQKLITTYRLQTPISCLLTMYRSHTPSLPLNEATRNLLLRLKEKAVLGLITDGRSATQRHKIAALGLDTLMDDADILISGDTGYEKPSPEPYLRIMERHPSSTYYYVGDNPSKDFVAPNRLGWTTICLLDNGQNIHPQDFSLPQPMLPQHTISQITEIENIII